MLSLSHECKSAVSLLNGVSIDSREIWLPGESSCPIDFHGALNTITDCPAGRMWHGLIKTPLFSLSHLSLSSLLRVLVSFMISN